MLVFLISAVEWAKLIIGLLLVIVGFYTVIRPIAEWHITGTNSYKVAIGCAAETFIGLTILLVGFFIAGW